MTVTLTGKWPLSVLSSIQGLDLQPQRIDSSPGEAPEGGTYSVSQNKWSPPQDIYQIRLCLISQHSSTSPVDKLLYCLFFSFKTLSFIRCSTSGIQVLMWNNWQRSQLIIYVDNYINILYIKMYTQNMTKNPKQKLRLNLNVHSICILCREDNFVYTVFFIWFKYKDTLEF